MCVCGKKTGPETPQISVTLDTFLHERKRQEHLLVLHCRRLSQQQVTTELWVSFVSQYQSKQISSEHGGSFKVCIQVRNEFNMQLQKFSPLNDG